MDFYAFPVRMGDCFLVKDEEFHLLVDGGDGRTNIAKYISKITNKLNVVICTHYDKDHIYGLIKLLRKILMGGTTITLDEVWLPDIFARINVTKLSKNSKIVVSEEVKRRIYAIWENEEREELSNEDIEKKLEIISELVWLCYHLSYRFGIRFRWFSFCDNIIDKEIDHNIYEINCKEYTRVIEPYDSDDEVIFHLTEINRESLVFRYNNVQENIANILFTADSNFKFCKGEEVKFNSGNTVVTVPHHGSSDKEHKPVYQNIANKDFFFVRSSERHSSRPCLEFKNINYNKRACTRCGVTGTDEQTVHLTNSNGAWSLDPLNSFCSC
ncbi:MBL fold metallo-hydrolase [Paenibacillus sp. ClWae2A]|uniref:MBL fold metallo-hydrolase n=1 Tax=Paenibacillus sp. ClWae2A TaxID=3057177 RepID=UPI0028F50F18|nr:MBL fold metallo-hydrolase [Paenibacillus sp. ClWae2A]MDT9722273.1 MBL fold metallo-hydrolase [Paenibacillus sp. ClWae2A]